LGRKDWKGGGGEGKKGRGEKGGVWRGEGKKMVERREEVGGRRS